MEKERQGPRPQPGRAAAKGTPRRPAPPARPYANRQPAQRRNAVAPPPPYLPAGRKPQARKQSPTAATPQARKRPPTAATPQARKRLPTAATPQAHKQPPTVRQQELAEERFRDALWPEARETPFQRRTAFLLSLLYALAHIACSLLLVHPLNVLTARMPFPVSDIVRAFLPALAGAALCSLTRLRFPDEPRMMLLAYRRLLREALALFVAAQALLWGEWDAQRMIARFAVKFAAPPLVVGTAFAVLLFYLDWLYVEADEEEDA